MKRFTVQYNVGRGIVTGNNFKQARKALGLTQRQLANELGLAKNGDVYLRKVENGRAEPSGLLIRALELLLENRELKSELINLKPLSYCNNCGTISGELNINGELIEVISTPELKS